MNAFIDAMSSKTKIGVNGSIVYTDEGVENPLVSLSTMLVRHQTENYILQSASKCDLNDLWLLAFQTRDVRGGKGERKLFYILFTELIKRTDKHKVKHLVKLIPEYGYWKDLWVLYDLVPDIVNELVKETTLSDLRSDSMSLLAKWIPRESGSQRILAKKLRKALGFSSKEYRQTYSFLNKKLKTVEINMCSGAWSNIEPGKVPGRNLKLHTRAFLNTKKSVHEDRVKCALNFSNHFKGLVTGETTVKGAGTVMPHEITEQIIKTDDPDILAALYGQWESIKKDLCGLGKMIPLSDVSGSMAGLPVLISMTFGILISEMNHSAFRNHVMTFSSTPEWVTFDSDEKLKSKVEKLYKSGWGMSTNFEAAMTLILNKLVGHKVPKEEVPETLIVFTDMGWDEASNKSFHLPAYKQMYNSHGYDLPKIVIWNLRPDFKDFHVKADTEGVLSVSGWSPNILNSIMTGDFTKYTPLYGLRQQLDAPRYDKIRDVLNS